MIFLEKIIFAKIIVAKETEKNLSFDAILDRS